MMHVKPSSSTKAIYAEFGRCPLIIKQKCQLIKYWKGILTMNEKQHGKKAYNSTPNDMSLSKQMGAVMLKMF